MLRRGFDARRESADALQQVAADRVAFERRPRRAVGGGQGAR
jgi:hypothetical protein